MSALVLMLLAHCLVPEDQAAGWKQTAIPAKAPALAAPAEVGQFRTGEEALRVEETARFEHSIDARVGRAVVTFEVPHDAQHLRVRFAQSLGGMKVDARAVDAGGRARLIVDGRRVSGDTLMLDWGPVSAERIEVTLHHHLRQRPVVAYWCAGWWEVISELPRGARGVSKAGHAELAAPRRTARPALRRAWAAARGARHQLRRAGGGEKRKAMRRRKFTESEPGMEARGAGSRRAAFEITELEIELPINPTHDGLRIAQLSDLHLGLSTPAVRIRAAIAAVNALGVDLVALTGDYVTNSDR